METYVKVFYFVLAVVKKFAARFPGHRIKTVWVATDVYNQRPISINIITESIECNKDYNNYAQLKSLFAIDNRLTDPI